MKKSAFSYLELIIAMTLVVVVAILTAPIMTSMAKKSTPLYGEFKCYARLVNNNWKLFQNVRINSDVYPAEDMEADDEGCKFNKPAGNISSYTITVYGGGGSGSMPYFDIAKTEKINFAPGTEGSSGEEKSATDSLVKAFDKNGVMTITFCDIDSSSNCIGKGGEVNKDRSSMASIERISKIINGLKENNAISLSDSDYLRSIGSDKITNALDKYLSTGKADDKDKLLKAISESGGIRDDSKYTGNSGQSTKIVLSNSKFLTASGGSYGVSDKYYNTQSLPISSLTPLNNSIYFYSESAVNPDISNNTFNNCNGENANDPSDTSEYQNYGKGGGGGVFICKIKNSNNLNSLNNSDNINYGTNNTIYSDTHVENQCYLGYGGAGAGGAIIIQWN